MCPREAELQHRDPAPLESRRRESTSGSFNPLFREPSLETRPNLPGHNLQEKTETSSKGTRLILRRDVVKRGSS